MEAQVGREFVLEIGTEEIPASYLGPAADQLHQTAEQFLKENRIPYGEVRTYCTPRRLAIAVSDTGEGQEPLVVEVIGPPWNRAFDEAGRPTRAAEGFAQAQGVGVHELRAKETSRGTYACLTRAEEGRSTIELLSQALPRLVRGLTFPKSMRWGQADLRFARPIRWILALFGADVIPFQLDGLRGGRTTQGNQVLGFRPIEVADASSYKGTLESNLVVVDFAERRRAIRDGIDRTARERGGRILPDDELLDEVTNLVEFPVPLAGSFDESFLVLPQQVIIMAMREHQRYFSVVDDAGRILPVFVLVANGRVTRPQIVAENNRRVLAARLSDAKFFWEEDLKVPLSERVEELRGVVWQKDLESAGSLFAKIQRVRSSARTIGEWFPGVRPAVLDEAALLCKTDLVTNMVREKEFAKLQGVMGKEYALAQGGDPAVAEAIFEHYLPRYGGDSLPRTPEGVVLSLADKLDTLTGFFHLGQFPRGSEDPFALRRQASGMVQAILNCGVSISLARSAQAATRAYREISGLALDTDVPEKVARFLGGRLETILEEEGVPYDLAAATLAIGFDDLILTRKRALALKEASSSPDFERLVIGQRRCANILRGLPAPPPAQPGLLQEKEERMLYEGYLGVKPEVERALEAHDYPAAFAALLTLRRPIDTFFDTVLVMCEDQVLRLNRLGMLKAISDLFLSVADFSRIVLAGEEGQGIGNRE
jgi:glycyl-tRNA synthetase beta chain